MASKRVVARQRARAVALAAVSLALLPVVGGAGFAPRQLPASVTVDSLGAVGRLPEQRTLGADVLASAGDPASLARNGMPLAMPVPELTTGASGGAETSAGGAGIPAALLGAYRNAERTMARLHPRCGVSWSLLAAIGRVESGHASGGQVDETGRTLAPILGPPLNGVGAVAAIRDTDRGVLDGDTVWDRAVGPMQFIPSTWWGYASDGNGDGRADPHNVYDATVAAGKYLCASGLDLRDPRNAARAVFRYNHSDAYVSAVLRLAALYARGVTPTASVSGPVVLASGGRVPGFPRSVGAATGGGAPRPKAPTTIPGPDPVPGTNPNSPGAGPDSGSDSGSGDQPPKDSTPPGNPDDDPSGGTSTTTTSTTTQPDETTTTTSNVEPDPCSSSEQPSPSTTTAAASTSTSTSPPPCPTS